MLVRDTGQFGANSREILQPFGLDLALNWIVRYFEDEILRVAYFHNPHLVFTLQLQNALDESQTGWLHDTWRNQAERFTVPELPPVSEERINLAHSTGGVHEGTTTHREMYLDREIHGLPFALHRGGMSFRVRVSLPTGSNQDEARVLVVLTRCPVPPGSLLPLNPAHHWSVLQYDRFPAFERLKQYAEWIIDEGAMPSVADCFVLFLRARRRLRGFFDDFAAAVPAGFAVVARTEKHSRRCTLRAWNQDGATGVMQPDWAYVVLDYVTMTFSPEAVGGTNASSTLSQVELEMGPSPALLPAAVEALRATRRGLSERGVGHLAVFGRKYHRLLFERGVT